MSDWERLRDRAGEQVSARRFAAAAADYRAALDALPAGNPGCRASLLKELGDTLTRLWQPELDPAACYTEALALLEDISGPGHPDVANVLNGYANALLLRGELELAEGHAERADAIMRHVLAGGLVPLEEIDAPTLEALRAIQRDALFQLTEIRRGRGRYAEAMDAAASALALAEQDFGPGHPGLIQLVINCGVLGKYLGRYAEAEAHYARAWHIAEEHVAPGDEIFATLLYNHAGLLHAQGRAAEGEPLCREALAIHERNLEPHHPGIALTLGALAALIDSQGRYAEAEALYRRTLAQLEVAFGSHHPEIALTRNNLASVLEYQGKLDEAEAQYRAALALREELLGPAHPQVGTSLNNLAVFCRDHGQHEAAASLFRRARSILENGLGTEHPHTLACRGAQAKLIALRPDLETPASPCT